VKDIYRNPIFYYIGVPAVITLWPLLVWAVYLPKTDKALREQIKIYTNAQPTISQILELDGARLKVANSAGKNDEFDYATAVQQVANLCGIPPTQYTFSSGVVMNTGGDQKSQSARVELKRVGLIKFSRFISAMQLRWANLQCTTIKLKLNKDQPDIWDIDIDLKYYY